MRELNLANERERIDKAKELITCAITDALISTLRHLNVWPTTETQQTRVAEKLHETIEGLDL